MDQDWHGSADVTRHPGRVSGAWTLKDAEGRPTRIRVEDILANDDPALSERAAAEAIVTDIYPGRLPIDRVERVLLVARRGAYAAGPP